MPDSGSAVRGIVAFIGLSFGLAWLEWFVVWRSGVTPDDLLKFQFAILPGTFAPAMAAWIVRAVVTREGFADAGLKLRPFRWKYYAFALVLPFVVVAGIVVLSTISGASRPDWSVHRALAVLSAGMHRGYPVLTAPPHFWLILPIALVAQSILVSPIVWGEEFGWRGYLQVRLFAGNPAAAAGATGLIWGVWHYPLILMGYQYSSNRLIGLLVFPISTVGLSIIFGWLRQETGSVWSASVAHAATNAIGGSLALLLFMGGPAWILVSYMGVFAWAPIALVCAWIIATGRLDTH